MFVNINRFRQYCLFIGILSIMPAAWSQDTVNEQITDAEIKENMDKLTSSDFKEYLIFKEEAKLEKARLKLEEQKVALRITQPPDFVEDGFIPIVAILMTFGTPIAIVGLIVWSRTKRRELIHSNVSKMVEKGVEIPAHLFEEEKPQPGSALRKGIVLITLGLGLAASFLFADVMEAVGFSTIPIFMGFGYLIVWKLEENKQNDDNQQGQQLT